MTFASQIVDLGEYQLPSPTGVRVQMLPFVFDDVRRSLPPEVSQYADLVERLTRNATSGVGYLTVDEAYVTAGESHRRPGKHVDGLSSPYGGAPYGGSHERPWYAAYGGLPMPTPHAATGMVLISSVYGCRGWSQDVEGIPGAHGACDHLTVDDRARVDMRPGVAYWCNSMAVHESVPQRASGVRQFVRISTPNDAPIAEGETKNRLGVVPNVPVLPRRRFLDYRPQKPARRPRRAR